MNEKIIIHALVPLFFLFSIKCMENNRRINWMIVPGFNVGQLTAGTGETDLIMIFGEENIKRLDIQIEQGRTAPGIIVFPNQSEKRIEVIWKNTRERNEPFIILRGKRSIWKTEQGISLGTSLNELEKINGGPFSMLGFGWDFSGTVIDFNEGILCKSGYCDSQYEKRKITIRLTPDDSQKTDSDDYNTVLGDRVFKSDNPIMKKLNPIVCEMAVDVSE